MECVSTRHQRSTSTLSYICHEAWRSWGLCYENYAPGSQDLNRGSLNTTALSVPVAFNRHNIEQLGSAIIHTGLEVHNSGVSDAPSLSSLAHGIGSCSNNAWHECDWEAVKPETALAIEYSKAALTLTLLAKPEEIVDDLRTRQDINLGADASARSQDEASYWKEVQRLILEMIEALIPASTIGINRKDDISQLVLIGDSATDDKFL